MTWSASPEPSPEVSAVRDSFGVRWRRDDNLWWGNIGHTGEDGQPYEDYRSWPEVLSRGPLTDATREGQ